MAENRRTILSGARRSVLARVVLVFGAIFFGAGCADGNDRRGRDGDLRAIRVMAAASVAGVMEKMGQGNSLAIEVDAGASGALARRVELGAKADIFVSADPRWIDRVIEKGLADGATRRVIVRNRLVVVVRADAAEEDVPRELGELGGVMVAMGEPGSVAAGRYARQALERGEVWEDVARRAAMAGDVVAATAFVTRGVCPAGIVYATNVEAIEEKDMKQKVMGEKKMKLRVAFEIDAEMHDPIVIEGVVLSRARDADAAARLLDEMADDAVWQKAWVGAGFLVGMDQAHER